MNQASLIAAALLVLGGVASAQSVSVTAGNLHGSATAGSTRHDQRPCTGQGMTVRSANGSASSSVSVSSSGGETAVAGAGSPGSTIERYDCRRTKHSARRSR